MASNQRWPTCNLNNSTETLRDGVGNDTSYLGHSQIRRPPTLPPPPQSYFNGAAPLSNAYMPNYSTNGYGYGGYGNYNMPYRNSLYGGYAGGIGMNNFVMDDAERRFIQYAEDRSRAAFANVESFVRVFNSISMMLDNTFFAMTSSFRAVLSVAENFGKLRTMFGQIWHSLNLFRLFSRLYSRFLWLMGIQRSKNAVASAWRQAVQQQGPPTGSTNWPIFAFFGFILSIPYIVSKFMPKSEEYADMSSWKSLGVPAKAAFEFEARSSNELSLKINDVVTLAPTYIQESLKLRNSGWAYAVNSVGNGGLVPLTYLVLIKASLKNSEQLRHPNNYNQDHTSGSKPHTKHVSFGENQIYENVDLDDYVSGKKPMPKVDSNRSASKHMQNIEPHAETVIAPTSGSPYK